MPANNRVTLVEKNIAFKIAQQFPAYFREHGSELVDMVEQYYRFVESESNMGVYNVRRMFEYRDVGSTLSEMIIYFKKKYMADLPQLDEQTTRVVIKNIMDLYRRKGTEAGIKLFFRMFYDEDVNINYPARHMLKPSDSQWKTGTFLQLFPNNNDFISNNGANRYDYSTLLSKNVTGSISKATAIVDKINFVYLNKTLTPIVYLVNVKGKFVKYDEILCRLAGEDVSFGKLNGSAASMDINLDWGGTTGNNIGDIFSIRSKYGKGGTAIVTELQDEFTGTVDYKILDGGWGYTVENTRILVSNQSIVLQNEDFIFNELETLRDSAGNEGVVIGQNSNSVGVKVRDGDEFAITRPISTVDRDVNFTLTAYNAGTNTGQIYTISSKNDSSPGELYAETANTEHAKVGELENIESIGLMTDPIANFLAVPLNSSNFNTVPPALAAMSGTANPVTLATRLDAAFDLTPFEIGSIASFENINPGSNYVNDVFNIVTDDQIVIFDRFEQVLLIDNYSATFSVGDEIRQPSTSTVGIITKVDNDIKGIYVRPYAYYGFKTGNNDYIIHKGNNYDVLAVERDYSSKRLGENATIKTETLFSTGRIAAAIIRNSGLGYVDEETVYLVDDDGVKHAEAVLNVDSQGITEGYWARQNSNINGYVAQQVTDSTPLLPTKEFAYQVLKLATGQATQPAELGIFLNSTRTGGFKYGDITEDGLIKSNDVLMFAQLANGTAPEGVKQIWDELIVPILKTESWFNDHINKLYVYPTVLDYYDNNVKIQDSDRYQEYSYEIKSTVDPGKYEKVVKDTMHLAGTKMFSEFEYQRMTGPKVSYKFQIIQKEDYVRGGDPIVGPNQSVGDQTIRADNFVWTVDTDGITTDNGV